MTSTNFDDNSQQPQAVCHRFFFISVISPTPKLMKAKQKKKYLAKVTRLKITFILKDKLMFTEGDTCSLLLQYYLAETVKSYRIHKHIN